MVQGRVCRLEVRLYPSRKAVAITKIGVGSFSFGQELLVRVTNMLKQFELTAYSTEPDGTGLSSKGQWMSG